ncbi:hypothetical protein B0T26DRAFT_653257 [Lasiosphaeria miniovina]|uniref:VOC domain-containing protein n=1 Tax=Lasiosphaeria miniovina TaxID=1954250 RepID=A0AA40A609_9PEZI|nr:uncharacterized protein B0T26DRAFT_653257 [Lasiosphaeria miniovina]KAK0709988.1 hypothetical protein B0T26DRAFT_653257 [Lasiosphaeria miniovina]
MSDYKAPKFGSPVWIGIAAAEVSRAHDFYSAVFGWKFKDTPTIDGSSTADEIRQFDFRPDVGLGGGILRVPRPSGTAFAAGHGGVCIYWLVEDIDKISEAIESAGGKMVGATEKEGASGLYRLFEDTEGNLGGVYQSLG